MGLISSNACDLRSLIARSGPTQGARDLLSIDAPVDRAGAATGARGFAPENAW
ncbi:hypothetical protein [Lysobacter niastensis]|nr:hypothetical protein [Lysobacter niastensis]